VAALLKKELGADVERVQGNVGEFTVWVGERRVAAKGWLMFPADRKILDAVRAELKRPST
jgi:hypothetical protein